MNLEQTVEELRREPVRADAVEQTLQELHRPRSPWPRRKLWLLSTALSSLAIVTAFWPKSSSDEAWATAMKALKQAKFIHIRLVRKLQTDEAWKSGDKFRGLSDLGKLGETRYNGSLISQRTGFLTCTSRISHSEAIGFAKWDLGNFDAAEKKIEGKQVTPKTVRMNGQSLLAYSLSLGEVSEGGPYDPPSSLRHVGFTQVTAYVDTKTDLITELDQTIVYYQKGRPSKWDEAGPEFFKAAVDYPSSLDESMFDPPAGAFDTGDAKRQVARLLAGSLGVKVAAGQRVELKAFLGDGVNVFAVWKGCPADYDEPNRFKVDGIGHGGISTESVDPMIRGFSSAKCMRPATASTPYCLMAESVTKPLPAMVDLTLPGFAADHSRTYRTEKHQVVGYHSRMVGTVVFPNVPVTPIEDIFVHEEEFGLSGKFW